MGDSQRTYSQDEVTEILKRALKAQSLRNKVLSHDELVEMAAEIGIDKDALDSATAELAQTKADDLVRQNEAAELATERARLFAHFVWSLATYLAVNTALFFVDIHFTGGTWYYWVLLGWGIGLLFQLRSVLLPHASLARRQRKEARRRERLERRAARAEARRRILGTFTSGADAARELTHGAKEFENAVQAGVAAMLGVAARKIRDHAERANPSTSGWGNGRSGRRS
jgi:2TM domain